MTDHIEVRNFEHERETYQRVLLHLKRSRDEGHSAQLALSDLEEELKLCVEQGTTLLQGKRPWGWE